MVYGPRRLCPLCIPVDDFSPSRAKRYSARDHPLGATGRTSSLILIRGYAICPSPRRCDASFSMIEYFSLGHFFAGRDPPPYPSQALRAKTGVFPSLLPLLFAACGFGLQTPEFPYVRTSSNISPFPSRQPGTDAPSFSSSVPPRPLTDASPQHLLPFIDT